jgi:OsmC-like protein
VPAFILKKHELLTEGTSVRVTSEKGKAPQRVEDFRIRVEVPTELSDDYKRGIEEAVYQCLIHTTLLNPPKISLEVQSVALAKS